MYIFYFFHFLFSVEEECYTFNDNYKCPNNENFNYPNEWDKRGFQTPPRNDVFKRHKPEYQDMHYLVGYAQLKYSKDKKSCTVNFITKVNPILGQEGKDYYFLYKFGDIEQRESSILLTAEQNKYPDGI